MRTNVGLRYFRRTMAPLAPRTRPNNKDFVSAIDTTMPAVCVRNRVEIHVYIFALSEKSSRSLGLKIVLEWGGVLDDKPFD